MSGHSKWATIKRKKAATDSKRGAAFTKIIREITVAARDGGGDLNSNARLRTVVDKAKAVNMPADNIKKAIQKGTGELPGVQYEEIMYEGYGPGGVAMLMMVMTDNKNRSAANIRAIYTRMNCSMAAQGAVSWQFEQKGFFSVPKEVIGEDTLMEIALDAGADDIKTEEGSFDITTSVPAFETVKKAFDDKSVKYSTAEITMVPKTYVKLEGDQAASMLKLMSALEDDEDIQNVYANFDIPQDVMDSINIE